MATRTYIITYDLHQPGQRWKDVDAAIDKIRVGGGRVMQSTWIITAEHSGAEIRDYVWASARGQRSSESAAGLLRRHAVRSGNHPCGSPSVTLPIQEQRTQRAYDRHGHATRCTSR